MEITKLKEMESNCDKNNIEPKKMNELNLDNISSPVLARLIEEVRNEEIYSINAYNRMHNRHNRSR